MNDPQIPASSETPDLATPETTAPTFQEASLGQRIGATLIDSAICIPISFIPILGFIVCLAYISLRDCLPFLDGQSIGKKALKIRAVTESGQSLSGNYSEGLIRNVVLLIPLFAIVELIILCTKNGKPEGLRRLGDEWAKTRVITQG